MWWFQIRLKDSRYFEREGWVLFPKLSKNNWSSNSRRQGQKWSCLTLNDWVGNRALEGSHDRFRLRYEADRPAVDCEEAQTVGLKPFLAFGHAWISDLCRFGNDQFLVGKPHRNILKFRVNLLTKNHLSSRWISLDSVSLFSFHNCWFSPYLLSPARLLILTLGVLQWTPRNCLYKIQLLPISCFIWFQLPN